MQSEKKKGFYNLAPFACWISLNYKDTESLMNIDIIKHNYFLILHQVGMSKLWW